MKTNFANEARTRYINSIMDYLRAQGEDVALVTSNTCNLPIVQNEEEGVMEISVKIVKKEYDECMQERADYITKCAEKIEKAKERERAAAEKKAKAEAKKKNEKTE